MYRYILTSLQSENVCTDLLTLAISMKILKSKHNIDYENSYK